MNDKQFSIIGFCHNLFCKRKSSAKRKRNLEEISAKKILEELIWRSNKQRREREYEELKDFSRSTPNLVYCQVNGNFTMKPTISIKRKNAKHPKIANVPSEQSFSQDRYDKECVERSRERVVKTNSLVYQPKQYSNVYRKLSLKTSKTKTRHKSFKQKNNLISENFNSTNIKNFNSCPNLNQITHEEHYRDSGYENSLYHKVDNIDDFTTNLFLDDIIPDENDLDLVSINFDIQ